MEKKIIKYTLLTIFTIFTNNLPSSLFENFFNHYLNKPNLFYSESTYFAELTFNLFNQKKSLPKDPEKDPEKDLKNYQKDKDILEKKIKEYQIYSEDKKERSLKNTYNFQDYTDMSEQDLKYILNLTLKEIIKQKKALLHKNLEAIFFVIIEISLSLHEHILKYSDLLKYSNLIDLIKEIKLICKRVNNPITIKYFFNRQTFIKYLIIKESSIKELYIKKSSNKESSNEIKIYIFSWNTTPTKCSI